MRYLDASRALSSMTVPRKIASSLAVREVEHTRAPRATKPAFDMRAGGDYSAWARRSGRGRSSPEV